MGHVSSRLAPILGDVGTLIEAAGRTAGDIDYNLVTEQLRRTGVILFRGFGIDANELRALVMRFSSELLMHQNPNRVALGDDRGVLLVDAHKNPIPAHCEMSYSPMRPDLQWFCCIQPAAHGGETTVYDGVQVLDRLEPATRALFEAKRLRWRLPFHTTPDHQRRFFGTSDRAALEARFAGFSDFHYEFDAAGNLTWEYLVSAIPETKFGRARAFANSYLGSGAQVTFEDGSEIPQHCRWDVLDATERVCVPVAWQAGDVLLIDNTRVLHGRRGFEDPARKVAAIVSNANFS
jgi:alpha-ketoglutarate-dependent taurine dioxygenase